MFVRKRVDNLFRARHDWVVPVMWGAVVLLVLRSIGVMP